MTSTRQLTARRSTLTERFAARRTMMAQRFTALMSGAGGRERGDVPGWVLITLMTAGLVVAIWAIAGPALTTMFDDALKSVKGP